jgi:hypothetical protein
MQKLNVKSWRKCKQTIPKKSALFRGLLTSHVLRPLNIRHILNMQQPDMNKREPESRFFNILLNISRVAE